MSSLMKSSDNYKEYRSSAYKQTLPLGLRWRIQDRTPRADIPTSLERAWPWLTERQKSHGECYAVGTCWKTTLEGVRGICSWELSCQRHSTPKPKGRAGSSCWPLCADKCALQELGAGEALSKHTWTRKETIFPLAIFHQWSILTKV